MSDPPYDSLNLSSAVGDHPEHVALNRRLADHALGMAGRIFVETRQVHSAKVVTASEAAAPAAPLDADGIISDSADLVLTMRFADCVPILLADRRTGAVGMGHAGWRGTSEGLAQALVGRMVAEFGSRPGDLLAGLGPAVCADHYPVGAEVLETVVAKQGGWARRDFEEKDGALHFDLCGLNHRQLVRSGVDEIEQSDLCTACNVQDWFSHRAEGGQTGRFGVYLAARRA